MSWLRVDDRFTENRKVSDLNDREFRVWMRTLCYAARNNGQQGRLTKSMRREIVGLDNKVERRFVDLGLLDVDEEQGVLNVHDWRTYNPKDATAADRAKRYRDRDANRDDDRDEDVTDTVTEALRDRDGDRDANGSSRVGARARPVPSRNPTPKDSTPSLSSTSPQGLSVARPPTQQASCESVKDIIDQAFAEGGAR